MCAFLKLCVGRADATEPQAGNTRGSGSSRGQEPAPGSSLPTTERAVGLSSILPNHLDAKHVKVCLPTE